MSFWSKKTLKKEDNVSIQKRAKGIEVLKCSLSNCAAKWPSRGSKNRIEPFCEPVINPQHTISKKDNVFTIGSCFARTIEHALKKQNFSVPSAEVLFPQHELWSGTTLHSGLLNKYTPHAILNELEFVFDDKYQPEDFIIECDKHQFYDMQLHTNQATSFERGIERRLQIKEMVRGFVSNADMIIVTLGLVETWWDNLNELYLNEMPPKVLIERYNDRFSFESLSPNQVFNTVEKIITKLKQHSKENTWIMITVSPIPLARTFRNQDVILSNMYSKSVLRVAAELEAERSSDVEYFPSYETVMLSLREDVWHDDQIHILYSAIEKITQRMIKHYCVF